MSFANSLFLVNFVSVSRQGKTRACALLLQWCTGVTPSNSNDNVDYSPFYTKPACMDLYTAHMKVLLNRVNTGAPGTKVWVEVEGYVKGTSRLSVEVWDAPAKPAHGGTERTAARWPSMPLPRIHQHAAG